MSDRPQPIGESTPIRAGLAAVAIGGLFGLFAYIRSEVHLIKSDLTRTFVVNQAETRSAIKDTDRRIDTLIGNVAKISGDVRVNTQSLSQVAGNVGDQKLDIRKLEAAVEKLSAQLEAMRESGR